MRVEQPPASVVDASIFRVEEGGAVFWVVEDSTAGAPRLVCSCPQRLGCAHVEAVTRHLGRLAEAGGHPPLAVPARAGRAGPSDSRPSIPPAAQRSTLAPRMLADRGEILFGDAETTRRLCTSLRRALDEILTGSIGRNCEAMRRIADELVRTHRFVRATDLLKSVADLRRAILEDAPDPVSVCIGIERVLGAIAVMRSHLDGLPIDPRLQTTYLGREWEPSETDHVEDAFLLEIARNSVPTPFGIRRSESYYMAPGTGAIFVEEKYHPPGGGNPSVGPFPKALHVNLMTIEPRLQPPSIELLQYSVRPPPHEGELLKIKTMALAEVEVALAFYKQVVEAVRSPYPVFVAFRPTTTRLVDGRLVMADSDGDLLGLAYGTAPHGCLAVEALCAQNQLHAICGFLVMEERVLALSPLSLLIENGGGLTMTRIK